MRQKQRKDSSAPNCALELRSEDSKRDELNIKLSPEQQPALTDPEPLMAPPVQILRANTDRKVFFLCVKKISRNIRQLLFVVVSMLKDTCSPIIQKNANSR